ncbi:MAG: NUDIX hydrolase [bacterium]
MLKTKNYQGVIAIITNDKNEVILGKKIIKPGHFLSDSWHLPGGKINQGEDVKKALEREMKEELSITIKPIKLLCDYPVTIKKMTFLSACYICQQKDPNDALKPADDLQAAQYFPKTEILKIHQKEIMKSWPEELVKYFSNF